jgi:hypothetical protein
MGKKTGRLSYNYNESRMGILDRMDTWAESGLHSGECFEVFFEGNWVAERIEYDSSAKEWYLAYSRLTGAELEGLKVRY